MGWWGYAKRNKKSFLSLFEHLKYRPSVNVLGCSVNEVCKKFARIRFDSKLSKESYNANDGIR